MRFTVYGAGAVGGSVGVLLAHAGYEVRLIARGDHLRAIEENGLLMRTPETEIRKRLTAVESPSALDWREDDVVFLGMKTQDTEQAIRGLDPALPVVCLQNGVANERTALRHFAHVYAICVMFPSAHLAPGVVDVHSWPTPGILDIGRFPGEADDRATRIAAALRAAGCQSEPRADIMRWKYRKLLMNLGNAVQAVCAPGDVAAIAAEVRAEGERVLAAAGIDPVSKAEDDERRGETLSTRAIGGQERGGGSSWQSLKRGTGSIESDYLNGEIVLLARLHAAAAPYNENARQLANRFARERRSPGTMTGREWLSNLDL
jgi:2-dehydropantoate 2-reductase